MSKMEKFSFIYCYNTTELLEKSKRYISELAIPENIEIEIIALDNQASLTSAYNKAMNQTNSKYKVYIHQDTYITNKNFIADVLQIFNTDRSIGLIGMIGAKQLSLNAVWWESNEKIGKVYESHTGEMALLSFAEPEKNYEEVDAVDGFIMISQYNILWREDIFKGWHFYDISQAQEFLRLGYKVVIPKQETAWCIHDCGIVATDNGYEENRLIFLNEYMRNKINLLNVIIRVHNTDERSLKSLSFCLFTLFGQNYFPLRPIIVCQNFDDEQLAKIKVIVDESLWDNSDIMSSTISHQLFYPIIHNVVLDKKGDFRSKLLNEGIKLSTGSYLAFLDYDDLIYGHAYSYLIDRLNKTTAAISFGDIKRTDVSYLDGYFYQHKKFAPFGHYSKNLHDLFIDNFCPIHSFVIDKNKIDSQDLYFDESLSKHEDYHLLLRLTAKYKSDFDGRCRFVGEYFLRTDGTNSVPTYMRAGDYALLEWEKSNAHIKELKKNIPVPIISVAEVAVLKQSSYQSAHLVQEINTLKEKLATEIKNIEAISQLLNLFFNVPENIKELPRVGNVYEAKQIGSNVTFGGWVADLEKQTSVLSLSIVHLPTHKTLGFYAPNILRPDVEIAMKLPKDLFYGFWIELQTTFLVSELAVLAILKNGEIIAINQASIFN